MASALRRLPQDGRGNVAILLALGLPFLLGLIGAAVDYARWISQQEQLQGAADAAALAVAKDFQIAAPRPARAQSVAESIARALLSDSGQAGEGLTVSSTILPSNSGVRVTVRQGRSTMLAKFLSQGTGDAEVSATAKLVGSRRMCIRGYETTAKETVFVDGKSKIFASTCDINSASTSKESVLIKGDSVVEAALLCSAAGIVQGNKTTVTGGQTTACVVPPDPLADRGEPSYPEKHCDWKDMFEPQKAGLKYMGKDWEAKMTSSTNRFPIKPGVYCKGLKVPGDWHVRFEPGTYIIKGDKFTVEDKADVLGEDVLFFMGDKEAVIDWKGAESRIALAGRITGGQAGLLIFEDRENPPEKVHHFKSGGAEKIVGTIYLPQSVFEMDFKAKFGNKSAFTVLLVKRLIVKGESEIMLNTDYYLSPVPVADGISGKGSGARLSE